MKKKNSTTSHKAGRSPDDRTTDVTGDELPVVLRASSALFGLTGGIGCGKSAALAVFAALGWRTLDADRICAELYRDTQGAVVAAMRRRWGGAVCGEDGELDRKRVAGIVFADKTELLWLNTLVHPLVLAKADELVAGGGGEDVMFDVPLLFEVAWERRFSAVVAVWAPPVLQARRLKERGWSDQEAASRLAAQLSADEKLERADYGIINSHDFTFLRKQCIEIDEAIKRKN